MKYRRIIFTIIELLSMGYRFIQWLSLGFLRPENKLRVLAYHQICPLKKDYPPRISQQIISTESFSEQMKLLSTGGYTVLTVNEALRHLNTGTPFPDKSVCITFDDGYQNYYKYAFPILIQYRMKATFYLTTGYINQRFNWIQSINNDEYDLLIRKALSWKEIIEMKNGSMEFASHSQTHPDFSRLSCSQMKSELVESRHILTVNIKSMEHSFVAPFGVWGKSSNKLKKILLASGYTGAFLGKFGSITLKSDCFDLPRIIIYADDSIQTFKQKIEGAYDWLGIVHTLYHHLRLLIDQRYKK